MVFTIISLCAIGLFLRQKMKTHTLQEIKSWVFKKSVIEFIIIQELIIYDIKVI